jgi:hypothetical protein
VGLALLLERPVSGTTLPCGYVTALGRFRPWVRRFRSERNRKLLTGRVNMLAEGLSKLRGMFGLN